MATTQNKIFTFQFEFTNPKTNKDDQIQFCAETQLEAIRLFSDWALSDEKMKKVPKIDDIELVYNQNDADEYGDEYGTPEEYHTYK